MRDLVTGLRDRAHHRVTVALHRQRDRVGHLAAQARVLSPQSTLDRGYAIVQHPDGSVVTTQADVSVGEILRVRVARGDFPVTAGVPGA